MEAKFKFANENLNAIITGLNPNSTDYILAIGGSGDQALALCEYGAKVMYVDNNLSQVKYFENVLKVLKKHDFDEFLNVPDDDSISLNIKYETDSEIDYHKLRNEYFSKEGRLEKISNNLHNITFIHGNIIDFTKNGSFIFNKIYLSNIFTTMSNGGINNKQYDFANFNNDIAKISKSLSKEGLIYFADREVIYGRAKSNEFSSDVTEINFSKLGFEIDKKLTNQANLYESYIQRLPLVIRKK